MMFNDERINFEMAKLKKMIIIISGVLSFLFLILKLCIHYFRGLQFCLYSTEIIIMLSSLAIMLGSLFIKADVKDEMVIQRKQKYYNTAFKILLYISFISYAVAIPATIASGDNSPLSSNMCINMIMMTSLFIGYGYLRLKKVYFNYNFIEENNKTYYKNVFKNIGQITKFFGIVYLIALVISIFYMFNYNPLSFIIGILLAFIFSVVLNSIYYLFISFLERLFYKEENKKKITTPTIILISIFVTCLLISVILNLSYYRMIENGIIDTPLIVNLANMIKNITELLRFFSVLGSIFLVADVFKKDEKGMKVNSKLVTAFIVFVTYEIFLSRIQSVVNLVILEMYSSMTNIGVDSFELGTTAIANLHTIQLFIRSAFYIILGILILILNIKKTKKTFGVNLILISWVIIYLLISIAYFMQNNNFLMITSYVCVGGLTILMLIYVLTYYFKKSNKISVEE